MTVFGPVRCETAFLLMSWRRVYTNGSGTYKLAFPRVNCAGDSEHHAEGQLRLSSIVPRSEVAHRTLHLHRDHQTTAHMYTCRLCERRCPRGNFLCLELWTGHQAVEGETGKRTASVMNGRNMRLLRVLMEKSAAHEGKRPTCCRYNTLKATAPTVFYTRRRHHHVSRRHDRSIDTRYRSMTGYIFVLD
jgi:hypothetical protein